MNQTLKTYIIYAFLIMLALMVLYPLYFAFISSFKSIEVYTAAKLALPKTIFPGNYERVFLRHDFHFYLLNTVITVGLSMFFYIIICAAAGLAFGKFSFKGKIFVFSLILLFQIFPQMVIAGELYQLLSRIRLLNTKAGLILAWLAYFCPFGTYIMTTYFATVPKDIIESARIDGTNIVQLLFKIMMPIAKPMLGTIGIIGTLSMWNELPFAMMILQHNKSRTVSVGIAMMQGEFGLPVPVLAAAVIVSAIIPTICYLIFQDYISMNATAGSIKG
jgi:ABC-type glycerol-3-phosphate transport system permease component